MASHTATAHAHGAHEVHAHGSAKYFKIGFVLFVLTALEVVLYELCYGHLHEAMPALGTSLAPWFVELLLALSAVKFWLVAMFYMHLKDDMSFLSWVFSASLGLAVIVIVALIALFLYNRSLWWASGAWG